MLRLTRFLLCSLLHITLLLLAIALPILPLTFFFHHLGQTCHLPGLSEPEPRNALGLSLLLGSCPLLALACFLSDKYLPRPGDILFPPKRPNPPDATSPDP